MTDPLRPAGRTVHTTGADGTVRDWLTAPARGTPVADLDRFLPADGDPWEGGRWVLTNGPDVGPLKERLARAHPIPQDQPLAPPVEHGRLTWVVDGAAHHDTWQRVRTEPDGLLDWSVFCFTPEYRHALAATVLETDQAEWRDLEVHTTGPFVLWLDGEAVLSGTRVSYMEPEVHRVRARLPSRTTTVHLATWQVAFRECRHIARLRVVGLPVRVVVPSPGADEAAARLAETILESVGSPGWGQVGEDAVLTAPPGVALQARVAGATDWRSVRVDEHGRVRVPLRRKADPASTGATMLASGESVVEVRVDDERCPQVRRIPVAALPPLVRTTPTGGPAAWRRELLTHAAGGGEAPPASWPGPPSTPGHGSSGRTSPTRWGSSAAVATAPTSSSSPCSTPGTGSRRTAGRRACAQRSPRRSPA